MTCQVNLTNVDVRLARFAREFNAAGLEQGMSCRTLAAEGMIRDTILQQWLEMLHKTMRIPCRDKLWR